MNLAYVYLITQITCDSGFIILCVQYALFNSNMIYSIPIWYVAWCPSNRIKMVRSLFPFIIISQCITMMTLIIMCMLWMLHDDSETQRRFSERSVWLGAFPSAVSALWRCFNPLVICFEQSNHGIIWVAFPWLSDDLRNGKCSSSM